MFAFAAAIFLGSSNAQEHAAWVRLLSGDAGPYAAYCAVDAEGSVYAVGPVAGDLAVDGTIVIPKRSEGAANSQPFILKHDLNGRLIWAKTFSSSSHVGLTAVAVDSDDELITTGFGAEPGHIVITKRNTTDGAIVWHREWPFRSAGFGGHDGGRSIAFGKDGELFAAGTFVGQVLYESSEGATALRSRGDRDAFVVKVSADGSLRWVRGFGGTGFDYANAVNVDSAGKVVIVGDFAGSFPASKGNDVPPAGEGGIFVKKYDPEGESIWSRTIQGRTVVSMDSTMGARGEVYVVGRYMGTQDFDPGAETSELVCAGEWDGFLLKLDVDGTFEWVRPIATGPGFASLRTVATDEAGRVYAGGQYFGQATFSSPGDAYSVRSINAAEAFIAAFESNGDLVALRALAGTQNAEVLDIEVREERIYATGWIRGETQFGSDDAAMKRSTGDERRAFILSLPSTLN